MIQGYYLFSTSYRKGVSPIRSQSITPRGCISFDLCNRLKMKQLKYSPGRLVYGEHKKRTVSINFYSVKAVLFIYHNEPTALYANWPLYMLRGAIMLPILYIICSPVCLWLSVLYFHLLLIVFWSGSLLLSWTWGSKNWAADSSKNAADIDLCFIHQTTSHDFTSYLIKKYKPPLSTWHEEVCAAKFIKKDESHNDMIKYLFHWWVGVTYSQNLHKFCSYTAVTYDHNPLSCSDLLL